MYACLKLLESLKPNTRQESFWNRTQDRHQTVTHNVQLYFTLPVCKKGHLGIYVYDLADSRQNFLNQTLSYNIKQCKDVLNNQKYNSNKNNLFK